MHINFKKHLTKKKIIWSAIILLVVLPIVYNIFKPKVNTSIQTELVKKQNIKATVLATGQVVSSTDLDLSFKSSGVVKNVYVKEGSKVTAGQTLATLEQQDALASLTSARGSLAQAQANYQKVLAGASNEEIAVAQKTVEAAKVALETAKTALKNTQSLESISLNNAYLNLLNSTLTAIPSPANGGATLTISGAYNSKDQGVYNISIYVSSDGLRFQSSGLENATGLVKTTPVALGSRGLSIQFSGTVNSNDSWTISIPNTLASTYLTNYNAYQAALVHKQTATDAAQAEVNSAQASLDSAQAALNLKLAQARPADLDAAQAQILSAQGQVLAAQAVIENMTIRAPAAGTITSVDIKPGELAQALKSALVLQDVGSLHVEAEVSEANISNIKPDQIVDITFDALGTDRHFSGKVQTINPAATVVSGVVNYKVVASLDNIPEIKPGMTANMTILTNEKDDVLAVPLRSIINKANKKYIRLIDDSQKKTYHEVEVSTDLEADGGLVEVISGLTEGLEVVTYVKK